MALKEAGTCITLPANADLSANQNAFVVLNTSARVALAGNGADAVGVLVNDPDAAGRPATIQIDGIAKVKVGTGGVTMGDNVAADTNGVAILAATGDAILGKALETAAAGAIISVLLCKAARLV